MTDAATTDRRVPEDRVMPRLAALFDLGRMSESLSAHWSAGEYGRPRILGCEVERVKYRPGRNCVVGYRVQVKWPRRPGRMGWRLAPERTAATRVCVAMYPGDEATSRYERAKAAAAVAQSSPSVSLLDEPGVLLWRFPHDRKLPTLPLLADIDALRARRLPELAQARWGDGWHIDSVSHELVSYFPHHSATLRARLQLRSHRDASVQPWCVYGKVRSDDSGARVFDAMSRLYASDACREGVVGFARPLAMHATERLLWQEGIEAATLDHCLRTGVVDQSTWESIAGAVAALHRTPLGLAPSITRETLQADIARAVATLTTAVPAVATEVLTLRDDLLRRLEGIDCAADATLHGDLHSKNILPGRDRVHLIDLDRVGAGPRLAEVGTLLAELVLRDCLAARPVDWRRVTAVAQAYGRAHGRGIAPADLGWHVAAAILCQPAHRCVTSLRPGRLEILPQLLCAARAAADGACAGARA